MIELDSNLTKIENLSRLGIYQYFVIEESTAAVWRNERQRYYSKHKDNKVFNIKKNKESQTIVIRVTDAK